MNRDAKIWICQECYWDNNVNSRECRNPNCNAWRHEGSAPEREGVWECCGEIQFASCKRCRKCNKKKRCYCGGSGYLCESCYYHRAKKNPRLAGDPFCVENVWFRFSKVEQFRCPSCDQTRTQLFNVSEIYNDKLLTPCPSNGHCIYCTIQSAGLYMPAKRVCYPCYYNGVCPDYYVNHKSYCKTKFSDNEKVYEEELIRQKEELIALFKKEESKI